ncbi:MAG: hypothetical protein J6M42_12625 [Clostridia bacterium]|nr:hypothetical protein [Clostridia bacterium]
MIWDYLYDNVEIEKAVSERLEVRVKSEVKVGNPADFSISLIVMVETEGFPPHLFTLHDYLLL